jgi:ubiquinone biosynthesis protein
MRIPLLARTYVSDGAADELDSDTTRTTQGSGSNAISIGAVSPRDLARLSEILLTFARHGIGIAATKGAFVVAHPQKRAPRALAVALRRSFVDLGPTFLKLGQFMASSPGLFPQVISDECCKLLENVPPEPPDKIKRVVEWSLGGRIEDMFREFSDEPVAAASIAQVHYARLHDGREVAVKIRRPGLKSRIEQDLRLLGVLALALQNLGAIAEAFNPEAIVEDFAYTLTNELDFRSEASRMSKFAANLASSGRHTDVVVPEPIEGMTSERVLVMTYIHGRSVAEVVASGSAKAGFEGLLRAGVRAWFESVFVHGHFHGDVHAGNLFLTDDNKVAFLDFGIMGRLDEPYRSALASAVLAVLNGVEISRVAQAIFALGAATGPIDLESATADIESLVAPLLDRPLAEISYGEVMGQILQIATKHRLRLPSELVLVAKQLIYFERYAKEIAPDYKILADTELWAL